MHKNEKLNSLSHLIGAVAALAGMVVLVVYASIQGDVWKIVSFSIYGVSLFLLYIFSTLYHGLHGRAKEIFHKLDHIAIYLLIAGTYTPFTLVSIRGEGAWGWSIFGVVWGLAIVGILVDSFAVKGRRILPIIIYVCMGWISLIAIKPLLDALSFAGFMWLLTGGLFYTLGIIFYALDHRNHYFHAIWHVFVLAGSISHYVAIIKYVL
ncbi:MAG: PAQR family membrane homeostasis protein TrhA [Gammaproteobacteria bacterium]